MKRKHITPVVLSLLGIFSPLDAETEAPAAQEAFKQDRSAILSMAGAFEVGFNFEEKYPLLPGYETKEPYHEHAKELVKVTSDDGTRIVLQHLLVVGSEKNPKIIKHWGQIWTFEDTSILRFEKDEKWMEQSLPAEKSKGTWSQLVTQTDDSPRYESTGTWTHSAGASEWISAETRRPLPRREYSTRDDYDLLIAENRHIVTKDGWSHFQFNRKRIESIEPHKDLCIEQGLNTYTRIDTATLAAAETWWLENGGFWIAVSEAWQQAVENCAAVNLKPEGASKNYARSLKDLKRAEKDPSAVTPVIALRTINPFITKK